MGESILINITSKEKVVFGQKLLSKHLFSWSYLFLLEAQPCLDDLVHLFPPFLQPPLLTKKEIKRRIKSSQNYFQLVSVTSAIALTENTSLL